MRSTLVVAALVGCGPASALEIVVEMPPQNAGIDRVQLYLGLGAPMNDSVERLVPRDYAYPDVPDGFYWKRDPNGAADEIAVAPGATDVRFVFQEGSHDQVTAVVVGFRGDQVVAAASLVGAYLDAGSVRQYHVALAPASAAFPQPTAAPVTVHRWGPAPADTPCVYLEDPAGADKSIFIVDEHDRDCDGFPDEDARECRPNVYRGKERPQRIETSCVTTDAIKLANETSACVLGGEGCVDGRGETDGSCDPSTTCVQPAICVGCTGRPDGLACMASLAQQNLAVTRVECKFVYELGTNKLCPSAAVLTQPVFARMCTPDAPYLMWSQGKWHAQAITAHGLTFTAPKQTTACDFKLEASGTTAAALLEPIEALLSAQFTNGRSAATPLRITFAEVPSCATVVNECHLEGEPTAAASLLGCLDTRVVEPW